VLTDLLASTSTLELVTDPVVWQTATPTIRRPTELVVRVTPS
jgi:hypothetical protein